ncbi:MAG: glycosyltransferase family 4 protein [bacterium]|nr:glycosyltransferase family 4 protein [bacterium]
MKIAIIIRRLNTFGGAQRQAIELAKTLADFGHIPTLYTFAYDPSKTHIIPKSVKVTSLSDDGYEKSRFLPYYVRLQLKEWSMAGKLALKIAPDTDILNPHGEAAFKVAAEYKRRVKNIPSVWMLNDMPTKLASFERAQAVDQSLRLGFFKKFLYGISDWIDLKFFILKQDRIAVLDNRDALWVKKYFGKDARIVRSGLHISDFEFKKRIEFPREVKILSTGIFFAHRRFEDIIRALPILAGFGIKARLNIVGSVKSDKKYAAKILSLVDQMSLQSSVSLLGEVGEDRLKAEYKDADVFVFASHMQSFGIAVFEALASGLPTVVSETSGASEILDDEKNAMIVSAKSPEKIAEAILKMRDNKGLYAELSVKGREFVEDNISWEKYSNEMLSVFNDAKASY